MRYLSIDELKKQCNIDPQYDGDNEYLEMIGDAAEDYLATYIRCPLDDIEAENGSLPATLRHALRILVDFYYSAFRGSGDSNTDIPVAFDRMVKLYRNYSA